MASVTGLVLLFAFTSAAVIWLARDVDRAVSHRAAAQTIAFQAARAAAQELSAAALRAGEGVSLDRAAAVEAARLATAELCRGYRVDGEVVRVDIDGSTVEVEVRIDDPAGAVTGIGEVRVASGP